MEVAKPRGEPLIEPAPNQGSYIALDRQQITRDLGRLPLARFMRQCGPIIGLGVNLCIESLDQLILVRPCEHSERARRLVDRSAAETAIGVRPRDH